MKLKEGNTQMEFKYLLSLHKYIDLTGRCLDLKRNLADLVNVTRQIHEGVYLNWLHKTILQLNDLFQIS